MIGLLMLAATTSGLFLSGGDLYNKCLDVEVSIGHADCLAYVSAAADASIVVQSATNSRFICLPMQVDRDRLGDVVIVYLHDHPEFRDETAGRLVIFALQQAYPCGYAKIGPDVNAR